MLRLNEHSLLLDYHHNRELAVVIKAERSRPLLGPAPAQNSWLTSRTCRLLWRLGRLLESTGGRLERRFAPFTTYHA